MIHNSNTTIAKRLLTVVLLISMISSVLSGCVYTSLDTISIPKPGVSFDTPSSPSLKGESETEEVDEIIPPKWRDHLYLNSKNKGYCKTLNGKILVDFIFVSDSESKWDNTTREKAENELLAEMQKVQKESEKFKANLDLYYVSQDVSIDIKATSDDYESWQDNAMAKLGYTSLDSAQTALKSTSDYECAAIVFVLNKSGRAFASTQSSSVGAESVVVYSDDILAYRHELLHLFGAQDFYFPKEAMDAAKKYLSDSVMLSSAEGNVDDLTAFIVGWTDTLSKNAEAFLEATKNLTEDYLDSENDKNRFTGFGTREYEFGIYEGDLVFGSPEGKGTFTWDNGDFYTGSWKNGRRTGKGKIVWANGDVYEGDFLNDERTGKGKCIWKSGDRYEGDFVNGERTGKGVYIWSNGDRYEGDFVNNARTGKGVYIWSNGDRYEGGFTDNKFDGYGVWTGSNGATREGKWENGEFIG